MARLMIVPIRNRGDSVLILSHHGDTTITGFIAQTTLSAFFRERPSMCECVSFVERNLKPIEAILSRKLEHDSSSGCAPQCVEITNADLARSGLSPPN
jgi:hypothetical protein